MLYVCPLSRLHETVRASGARHVVTLINDGTPVERPPEIAPENHLFLGFNDISVPMDGMTPPGEVHVRRFMAFIEAWDRSAPIVIHCWAGVSRSTAGAFVAACMLSPEGEERTIAQAIREKSPMATPNALFVEVADRLLDRDGRMVEAVREIGRGSMAFENDPFVLTLDRPQAS